MGQYSRELKDGTRWYYKFKYNSTVYFSKCIYLSKKEARRAENIQYEEVAAQERNPTYKPILSLLEAISERLDYIQIKKSQSYYIDNRRYFKILLDYVGDIPFQKVSKAIIEDLLLSASQKHKSAGRDNYSINAMLRSYKALFNYIIEKRELNIRNPCKGIQKFSIKKKLKYIPRDKDIEAVKSICDIEQIRLIDFVMETGCRIGEAIRITGADILENEVILYTKKSFNSDLTPRKLPKPECIKDITIMPDERLFARWADTPRFLEDKVRQLGQRNWNWHSLRHRRASIWHNKEKRPLYEVMVLLGHSNLKTTQGYLQLIP